MAAALINKDRLITTKNSNRQYSTFEVRVKFLKKLWCCVGGRVQQGNLVLTTELKMYICHRRKSQSVSPSSESEWLTLKTSTLKLFTMANLRFQLS